jgi:hypothetical protein
MKVWIFPKIKTPTQSTSHMHGIDRRFDPPHFRPTVTMPAQSTRKELLDIVDQAEILLAKLQYQDILDDWSDSDSEDSLSTTSDDDTISLSSSTPSPLSPLSPLSSMGGTSELDNSSISSVDTTLPYDRLRDTIQALRDEVKRARVLHKPDEPPPQASQLHMLVHHEEHCPHLFRQKLHVNPEVFDDILDHISNHPNFQNQSNNPQLPVSIQLAIFLNRAGHYGNAITLENVAQWAGVSVGSVVNCTNRVMIAVLDAHDQFICFPAGNSEDADLARKFAESRTCPEWKGGFLAIDGSTVNLFTKPGYYGETFFDRKSNYSLGCQVIYFFHLHAKINLILGDHLAPQPPDCWLLSWSSRECQ